MGLLVLQREENWADIKSPRWSRTFWSLWPAHRDILNRVFPSSILTRPGEQAKNWQTFLTPTLILTSFPTHSLSSPTSQSWRWMGEKFRNRVPGYLKQTKQKSFMSCFPGPIKKFLHQMVLIYQNGFYKMALSRQLPQNIMPPAWDCTEILTLGPAITFCGAMNGLWGCSGPPDPDLQNNGRARSLTSPLPNWAAPPWSLTVCQQWHNLTTCFFSDQLS